MVTYERECCARGYHVCKDTWEAAISEELECAREQSDAVDLYAVTENDTIVGHLPKMSAHIYSLFLRRGSVIQCRVAGSRNIQIYTSRYTFSLDKISPPQVLGERGENFHPAKITHYGIVTVKVTGY